MLVSPKLIGGKYKNITVIANGINAPII